MATTEEMNVLNLFQTFLEELRNRLEFPYKHAYRPLNVVTGRAIGYAGTPRFPTSTQEHTNASRIADQIISNNRVNSAIQSARIFAQQKLIPFTIPLILGKIVELNTSKTVSFNDLKLDIQNLLEYLATVTQKSLPRLQKLMKLDSTRKLQDLVHVSTNESANTKREIEEQAVRHAIILFARLGENGMEEYIRSLLHGAKTAEYEPPIFQYEYLPYLTHSANIPDEIDKRIATGSYEQIAKDLMRTPTVHKYKEPVSTILTNYKENSRHVLSNNIMYYNMPIEKQYTYQKTAFAKMQEEIVKINDKNVQLLLEILEDVIIRKNISYTQGMVDNLMDFINIIPNKSLIKQLFYYFLKEYSYEKLWQNKIMELVSFFKTLNILYSKNKNDNNSTHYSKNKNDNNSALYSVIVQGWLTIFFTRNILILPMRKILFDLLFRGPPIFIIYLLIVLCNKYNVTKMEDVQYLSTKFSNDQLRFAGINSAINYNNYNKFYLAYNYSDKSIQELQLFSKGSPFQSVLEETIYLMINITPETIIANTDSTDVNKNSMSSLFNLYPNIFTDSYAIFNSYKHIQEDLEDRLLKPVKVGLLDTVCWKHGFIGIKGTPMACSSKSDMKKIQNCLTTISSELQNVSTATQQIDYTRLEPSVKHVRTFIQIFLRLQSLLQTTDDCTSLERIKIFSENAGTYSKGDLAFFKRLAQPYLNMSSTVGGRIGKQKNPIKTRRSQGRLRRTLKRR